MDILTIIITAIITFIVTWITFSLMAGIKIGDNMEADILIKLFSKEREELKDEYESNVRQLVSENADLMDSIHYFKREIDKLKGVENDSQ